MKVSEPIVSCFHCGEPCENGALLHHEHDFCCQGCIAVYDLLKNSGLSDYYENEKNPGIKTNKKTDYTYLDDVSVESKLLSYADDKKAFIKLHLPAIHCSSCVWLLENISRLDKRIIRSTVNYLKKEATIVFDRSMKLSELSELLDKTGYSPDYNLNDLAGKKRSADYSLNYKLGVAGFCFGNIMLLSLPAYLGADFINDVFYLRLFSYLQFTLALPVVFYVAVDYYRSAWYSLKSRTISIDIPLTLGIFVLFGRSIAEIFTETGFGFFDSLSGLLFFMMIGKWFQQNTYENMVFDRDYKSYFPIAVTKEINGSEKTVPLESITTDDILVIRNGELVPCDGILLSGSASLDYSFVTGENEPVIKNKNEHLYSGAKVRGSLIRIKVLKSVDQSYLIQLWNSDAFTKRKKDDLTTLVTRTSSYFTLAVLFITAAAAVYWYFNDPSRIADAVTYILIITCPCAFALSTPFTFGNVLRFFGKNGFYVKDANVIENMAKVDTIVFDKTGTLTYLDKKKVVWQGNDLSGEQKAAIYQLCNNSTHPFSRSIAYALKQYKSDSPVEKFRETAGKGIQALYKGVPIKTGSPGFTGNKNDDPINESRVYVSFDNQPLGYFTFLQSFREGSDELIAGLNSKYDLHLLSGDRPVLNNKVLDQFGSSVKLFNQSPVQKLNYIEKLNSEKHKVAMIGDGLNDAGALAASNFGITVTDDVNSFSPSSDAILNAGQMKHLPSFFRMAKESLTIIKLSFLLSFIYNVIGLSLAVTASLTPLFAAVFMPLSSITIILFVTSAVNLRGTKIFKSSGSQS